MDDGQVYFTFIEKIHFYIEHIFHFYNCTFSQEGTIIMLVSVTWNDVVQYLVTNIFAEINVSIFGVKQWQRWKFIT